MLDNLRETCDTAPIMALSPYAAWLVDLDGTLYSALPLRLTMGAEVLLAGPVTLRIIRRFRKEHERLRTELHDEVGSPYALQLERTAAALGVPAAEVEAHVREWMVRRPAKWIVRFRRTRLLDELAAFRAGGGKTALVSDYPALTKLEALGLRAQFDVVVANGEPDGPRRLKPHPDGYLQAASRLGVAPDRCLVIGDRDDADGEAARAAGMGFRKVG